MPKYQPICKKCSGRLYFRSFGSMSSSHSNIYECSECGRKVEIYDSDLEMHIDEITKKF